MSDAVKTVMAIMGITVAGEAIGEAMDKARAEPVCGNCGGEGPLEQTGACRTCRPG